MDLKRLNRALSVEAESGFGDLQGREQTFSQFFCGVFGQDPPADWLLDGDDRRKWQELGSRYTLYPELDLPERQHLVAETRRWLDQIRRQQEPPPPARPAPLPKPNGLSLEQPLQFLKGIGPKSAEKLAQLGLLTVRDALYYFPRDHVNYSEQVLIRQAKVGETVTLVGTIKSCTCFTSPKNKALTIFNLKMADSSGTMTLSRFYNGRQFTQRGWQESIQRQYPKGARVAASGLVKRSKFGLTLDNPQIEVLSPDLPEESPVHGRGGDPVLRSLKIGKILPIYPLTEGITADLVRKAVQLALPAVALIGDPLPQDIKRTLQLLDLPVALQQIHFPDTAEHLAQARRRLVFDEFFYLQLGLLQRRQRYREQAQAVPRYQPIQGELVDRFYQLLPFQLTAAQQRVISEILADLRDPLPMNRLVQGDVGSGKTVVAVVALLAAIQSGWQTALMAPTEVLAEQHYRKLVDWFSQLHLPVELLTGSTPAAKRRQILRQLQTGELPLVVGTHALIQPAVQFRNLGLVIIDEQHRFGVEQRAALQQKGDHPDVLTMTATPIPRTLTLALHGDLDVSQIDELPPGRKPVHTVVVRPGDRLQVVRLMEREIAQGRQVYVVLPLIEESEKLDLKSAIEEHQRLQEKVFPQFKVGLLHGRMSSNDKDAVIQAFRQRELDILVSTTVVEVGVDVPNASVMVIEHAERFGLSQLHQLRGRVGRGSEQSYCLLMTGSKGEDALRRLKVLEQSHDGFFIAEMDLRFRGPGEVMGTRQSGLPDFALASLMDDQEVLELARQAAEQLIAADPHLTQYPELQAVLKTKVSYTNRLH
ncbi:ATP-dependent DNA helicase RecG [Thermostichus vulcanus]|uniref:ATP-dependent DNA helicase RecG n=1 Tax=Thermostichus vulcanus str. 'Rupite' TaxID=2813851 RepID=A0ABT0C7E0_THEVL|nr:ATP-dependent DNA helicase RecG [Thermostichus vulcanus str. 'Rupite']